MKLNTNNNSYIIIYSAILVVVVAFLLAFVYQALKPMQDKNVALDVKKQILYSLNIRNLDGSEAEAKYADVVKDEKELDGRERPLAFALSAFGVEIEYAPAFQRLLESRVSRGEDHLVGESERFGAVL